MSGEAGLATGIPLVPPRAEFLYEAIADIGPTIPLGASPLGERRMVNILGGRFAGPGLNGVVLAGGADRQLVRADGVTELDALYEMRTDDGAVLTVNNRVLVDCERAVGATLLKDFDPGAGRPIRLAEPARDHRLPGEPAAAARSRADPGVQAGLRANSALRKSGSRATRVRPAWGTGGLKDAARRGYMGVLASRYVSL